MGVKIGVGVRLYGGEEGYVVIGAGEEGAVWLWGSHLHGCACARPFFRLVLTGP